MCNHEDTLGQEYVYRLDDNDNIIYVSDNWSKFATDNDAPDSCVPPLVLNKPIWEFILAPETAHLYRILLEKVRAQKRSLTVPFRCDSPDCRRFMRITIKNLPDGHLQFVSKIINIEWREPQPLLDINLARSKEFVRICSFCKKIAVSENDWAEIEQAVARLRLFEKARLPGLTHGMCQSCYTSLMERLD